MSKQQNPFEGIPIEQVESHLEANCDAVTEKEFYRPFTPEEKQAEHEHYQNLLTQKEAADNKLNEAKEWYKAETKPLLADIQESRAAIRNNGRRITGKVYIMKDWSNNLIDEYDNRGSLINRRPMLPEERQKSIPMGVRDAGNM